MTKRFIFILFLVCGYLFFLVLTFPAIHAYRFFHDYAREINPSSVEGTVWNMQSDNLRIGNWLFHTTRGSLNLLPLLAGNISIDVNLKGRGSRTSTTIKFISDKEIQFTDLKAKFPAHKLALWLRKPNSFGGNLNFKMNQLSLIKPKGSFAKVKGKVVWKKASIGAGITIKLGKVVFDVKSQGKTIKAKIHNSKSKFSISGQLELKQSGQYSLFAKIGAKSKSDLKTKLLIKQLGKTDSKGRYHFRLKGRI